MSYLPKSAIFGCHGPILLIEEKEFFKRHQPLGFILFKRNCENFEQTKHLIKDLKACLNYKNVPILIDQEGGRVIRLTEPLWRKVPPAQLFGRIAKDNLELAAHLTYNNALLIGQELRDLGINVNCAPCVDLLMPDADPIIGDRAFSENPEINAFLSMKMIKGLQNRGIIPIIKHLPGHGRAPVDSHEQLPIVENNYEELNQSDFKAFKIVCQQIKEQALPLPWGMTSHVIYQAVDNKNTATHSPKVIDTIIRREIGFEGFLISDCLTMKALEGSMHARAQKALEAGCDAVLHCKGQMSEMEDIVNTVPSLSLEAFEKLKLSFMDEENPQPLNDFDTKAQQIEDYIKNSSFY